MKRSWKTALGLILLLVVARAVLPLALKNYVNKTLDGIPGYYGRIGDIDVSLWRGAYQIQDVSLMKVSATGKEPFFSAKEVDISVDWRALLDRRIVTSISLTHPKLEFVQRESKKASQTKVDESWQEKVGDLVPFEINRFAIVGGLVRYRDLTREPKLNVYFRDLDMSLTNISNAARVSARLPSDLALEARALESGRLKIKGKADLLAAPAEFDLNASLRGLDLKEINDLTKAYGGFDFEKGRFDMTVELAASKTQYKGYVKTLMTGVDVSEPEKEKKEGDSLGQRLWERLVGAGEEILENQNRDRFAARIPISGSRAEVKLDSWATIGSILKNGFIKAMSRDFEENVEFQDVAREPAGK